MEIGYIRVSTKEQNTVRQEELMKALRVEGIKCNEAVFFPAGRLGGFIKGD